MPLRFSVIVLTRNRRELLAACLDGLAGQSRPADEILVVDNGSTDGTAELLTERRAALPTLRVLEGEDRGSFARARNRGARAARGDWLAFLDDDCLPAPDWLERLEAAAREGAEAVGGLVEPASPLPRRRWWHPLMGSYIGISVPGHEGPEAGSLYYPYTSNLALRRELLLAEPFQELAAGFDDRAGLYLGGREDAELWRRLRRAGRRCRFEPAARVAHHIDAERLRWRYLWARALQDGMALQRREPSRALWRDAADSLGLLPRELTIGALRDDAALTPALAWRLLWARRQWGQCRQAARREGALRGWSRTAGWALGALARRAGWIVSGRLRALALLPEKRRRRRRRKPVLTRRPRSVVLALDGYLGDAVLAHPFVAALKHQCEYVELTLVTNRIGEAIFCHEPAVDHLLNLDALAPGEQAGAIQRQLEAVDAELILAPYWYRDPAPLFRYRRARLRCFGQATGFPRRRWARLADERVAKPPGRHEGQNLLNLFRAAGLEHCEADQPLPLTPDELLAASERLRAWGYSERNTVALAPGCGQPFKLWREEGWAHVLQYLADEFHLHLLLCGSPDEEAMCRRIVALAGRPAEICCPASIREMAALLGAVRMVLTVDSGARHLAASMDTPTLALFGPTDERQWAALRKPWRHGIVRAAPFDLSWEEWIGLPGHHQMACIRPEQVCRALDVMLGRRLPG